MRTHRHCHRITFPIQINYENHPYLLTEEIYNRHGKKSQFSEQDLWFLLLSLTEARTEALEISQKLGDIRPNNIFLNEHANLKLTNSLSWPLEHTNIQKTMDKI